MKKKHTIHTLDELDGFAEQLVSNTKPTNQAVVITLTGDLGAGKTTLTQHIAKHLGVSEEVSSPTFVIAKYYDLKKQSWDRLIHIDAYRLDGEPLEPLGFSDLFENPANLIIIEWPQYIESVLPEHRTDITISISKNDSRVIEIIEK